MCKFSNYHSTTHSNNAVNSNKDPLSTQVNHSRIILDMWFMSNRPLWCNNDVPNKMTEVIQNGKQLNTEELGQLALQYKRSGDYARSIGAYIQTMSAYANNNGKIPLTYVRGLFKAYVCANEFDAAFSLVSTAYADIQQDSSFDAIESNLIKQYFFQIFQLAIEVIDNGNTSIIYAFAANYSGNSNYSLVKSSSELIEELRKVRTLIKIRYNK